MDHPKHVLDALPNRAAASSLPQSVLDSLPPNTDAIAAALGSGATRPANLLSALPVQGGFVLPANIRAALPTFGPPLGSTGVPDSFAGPFGSAGTSLDWGTYVGGVPVVGPPANEYEVLTSQTLTDAEFVRDTLSAPGGLGSSVLTMNLADPAAGAPLVDPGVDTGFKLYFRARANDDGPHNLRMILQMDNHSGGAICSRTIGSPSNTSGQDILLTGSFADYVIAFTNAECALFDFLNQRFRVSLQFSGGAAAYLVTFDFKKILLTVT